MNKKVKNYPKHIAFILDGNRRWAKEQNKNPWEGHLEGFKKILQLKEWMIELNIKEITLYCFSMQNFNRDKKEVFFLMKIFEKAFSDISVNQDVHKYKIQIKHIGQIELLPKGLQKKIKIAEQKTSKYTNFKVNFAIAYGGQEEIIEAVKKIIKSKIIADKITLEEFKKYLYLHSYPDIIIRTSGEVRTSNFLVWQQAYSEWFFLKKYWPDFTKKDLRVIINNYLDRERRYGK